MTAAPWDDPPDDAHAPPACPDSEQAVLGAALTHPRQAMPALAALHARDLHTPDHQAAWNAIQALHDAGDPLTPATVLTRLNGAISRGRAPLLIADLIAGAAHPSHIPWHLARLHDATRRRDTQAIATRLAQAATLSGDAFDTQTARAWQDLTAAVEHRRDAAGEDALPILDWHHLWADDTDEEWLVEPIIPARRLVALYSPPKMGKSLLALEIAAAVATGRSVLGQPAQPPQIVLYVDHENDPKVDTRERLQAMGYAPADLANLRYLSFPVMAPLDTARGGEMLTAAATAHGAALVVLDTVSRTIEGEENENDTWLRFYSHTGVKLKAAGISLLRLDHSGKDVEKGMRGGSAKSGDVDAVWRLSKVTDTVFRLDCTDARMPVSERTLTLHRQRVPHLEHRVDAHGRAAAWDAGVQAVADALEELEVDPGASIREQAEVLKATGVKAGSARLRAAVKIRRDRSGIDYGGEAE